MMSTKLEATIEDLYAVEGKAEIINGEIVHMPPTGDVPGYAGDEIFVSLREHCRHTGNGRAVSDNKGFSVNLPHRKSFSPDAAYYTGRPMGAEFFEGAPVFAAEVRSKSDYGAKAESRMQQKRADYFATGTLVVWDVDVLRDNVVRVYRVADPDVPQVFRRGEMADAEPAVPEWRMPVDDLFE
ncbi:MAG: Uma2 family endonuclease [Acidobacteriota bacterium]|nr:Uma2 family endonuclease [Acidobacteriota bacterium]